MALLSLSMSHPSEFMEVPPSPPQSPPVVDHGAFSPPSPAASSSADSPLGPGFLCLPSAGGGRAKRRKQERPSFFVERQAAAAEDLGDEEGSSSDDTGAARAPTADSEEDRLGVPLVWTDADDTGRLDRAPSDPRPEVDAVCDPRLPVSELHAPMSIHQTPASPAVQSSTGLLAVQNPVGVVPPVYPGSPAVSRVKYAAGAGSDDGEGDGSDGGGGGVPETCPECRKVFKRRVYLQRHMAREHWSTAKVFKCDTCAYQTKHQSNLLVHRRTHTGERPYHCGACGQRYTQGHLLKAHIRSRHGAEMAYYNMDKRSDGVRCRRSLSAATTTNPALKMNQAGLKEDKIWFLLEAAEAARGGGGVPGPRAGAPGPPGAPPGAAGPFAGLSLGQYVNALSGLRPLLWNPSQTGFQPPPLPHDGVTSHAALLSSLAAAPLPAVQGDPASQGLPGGSLLNSLLASYATGSPLFSINGPAAGPVKPEPPGASPLRCPSAEGPAMPQDLSMSRDGGAPLSDSGREVTTSDASFQGSTSNAQLTSTSATLGGRYAPSQGIPQGEFNAAQPICDRQWPDGLRSFAPAEKGLISEEQATDLSVRPAADLGDTSFEQTPPVPHGTVNLSARGNVQGLDRDQGPGVQRSGVQSQEVQRPGDNVPEDYVPGVQGPGVQIRQGPVELLGGDRRLERYQCCGSEGDAGTCPHLRKLKQLRRNVYRMLSVFTPYMDVAAAGIADVEADSVDDFLHEVIYSSKLDGHGHD